jgi:hypothetical protein
MKLCSRQMKGTVSYSPYWFQRGGIVRETGNDMPMDMREFVPEEFVVDFLSLVDLGYSLGHSADLFNQLKAFGGCKLE